MVTIRNYIVFGQVDKGTIMNTQKPDRNEYILNTKWYVGYQLLYYKKTYVKHTGYAWK